MSPNIVSPQVPIDIGELVRNARSICQNRDGRPRSRISRTGHGSSDKNETYVAVRANCAPDVPPYSRENAADHGRNPPEIPPK